MGFKVNDIIKKLLVKVLPPIIGEPIYETTNKIIQCFYRNSDTLATSLVRNGQIGLIMNTTLYTTIDQTMYMESANPGTAPNTLGMVTEVESAQKHDHHTMSRKV